MYNTRQPPLHRPGGGIENDDIKEIELETLLTQLRTLTTSASMQSSTGSKDRKPQNAPTAKMEGERLSSTTEEQDNSSKQS